MSEMVRSSAVGRSTPRLSGPRRHRPVRRIRPRSAGPEDFEPFDVVSRTRIGFRATQGAHDAPSEAVAAVTTCTATASRTHRVRQRHTVPTGRVGRP